MTQKQGGTAQWNVLPNAPNDSHLHELIRVLGIALVGQVTDEELIAAGGQTDCQDAYYTLKAMKKRNESNHRVLVKELLKDRNQACHGNLLSRDTVNVYWAFVNTVRLCEMLGAPPSNFINTFNLGKLIWLSALQPNDLEKLKNAGVDLQRQIKFTLFVDEDQKEKTSDKPEYNNNNNNTEAKKEKQDKQSVLCKFGASCANPACTFVHRSLTQEEKAKEPCKLGSACQFQGCLYAHPSAPSNAKPFVSKLIQCKFGGACTRPDCSFGHADRDKKPKPTQPSQPSPQQPQQQQQQPPQQQQQQQKKSKPPHCKFGINCTRQDSCTFYHPPFIAPTKPPKDKSVNSSFIGKSTNSSSAPNSPANATTECKFGAQCKREDCRFSHPIPVSNNASFVGKATTSSTNALLNFQPNTTECKFGAQCTRGDCRFSHPSKTPSFANNSTSALKNEKEMPPCKFGSNCNKKDCVFLHK